MNSCKRLTADSPLSWRKVTSARLGTVSLSCLLEQAWRHFGARQFSWRQPEI